MALGALLVLLLPFLLSLGLGFIPVVNQYLHWNLWYVVPISGLILGLCMGWAQFRVARLTNVRLKGGSIAFFAAAAAVAYIFIDFGLYYTTIVTIPDGEGGEQGPYRLAELMTFLDFILINLGSSTTGKGSMQIELGATGTTISYVADLLGCFAAAAGTLLAQSAEHPYCARCMQYKKRDLSYAIPLQEQTDLERVLAKLASAAEVSYSKMLAAMAELAKEVPSEPAPTEVRAVQSFCPGCHEATLLGKVFAKNAKGEWTQVDNLNFSYHSQAGEHTNIPV